MTVVGILLVVVTGTVEVTPAVGVRDKCQIHFLFERPDAELDSYRSLSDFEALLGSLNITNG